MYLCYESRVQGLNQRITYLIFVSLRLLEEYHVSLKKTAVGMVGYIPTLRVHFKIRGQTQVVLGQVRSRNNRTSSPRLFLCNLWIYDFEKTFFLKKKGMIRSREQHIDFSDDTPK